MDDFNFFLKLAKPLVFNLPDAKDRAMAALWLKKLCQANSSSLEITPDNIHVEYLKLLLFVMQTNRLTGIFEKPPPSGSLQELLAPGQRKAKDMISLVKSRRSRSSDGKSFEIDHPRVITSIGGDMCEYVAVQEIPNFGIHGYYAISSEPLPKWFNPQSYEATNPKSSSNACGKNTCDFVLATKDTDGEDVDGNEIDVGAKDENSKINEFSKKKNESGMKHGEKSLQKIFQAQRNEIAGVETRPCWGRSRYIDRLIDQSPHLVADLDLSEADALLHRYRDKKFRKIKKSHKNEAPSTKVCVMSSRRREAEWRLDMPPCASFPESFHDPVHQQSDIEESRTCEPKNFDSDDINECCRASFNAYLSNEKYHHPNVESAASISISDYEAPMCNCTDDQYESELVRTTDYGTWRDYAYETGETDELLTTTRDNENRRRSSSLDPTMTKESDAFREMHQLIADPNRRKPPSRGQIKAPRFKPRSAVDETNVENEVWNPQGHSTKIEQ